MPVKFLLIFMWSEENASLWGKFRGGVDSNYRVIITYNLPFGRNTLDSADG